MTNEERDLILNFIQRFGGAPAGGFASSVPATQPGMPPVDREADAFIAEQFARYPDARYRITQMAFVQEHALAEAQNQINRLQWELQNLRQQQQQQQQQAPAAGGSPWGATAGQPPQQSRGLFGGLFGGRAQPPAQPQYQQPQYQQPQYQQPQYAPPPPQYAPGYQPGMFQQRGSGFLGSALTTAAGVAGGLVAGNALMNMFSGGHGSGFGGGGFGHAASAPSLPPADQSASPWSSPTNDAYESGGAAKDAAWDNSGNSGGDWQQAASDQGGWQDAPSDQGWQDASNQDSGGGWDDAGGSDPDNA